IGICLVGNFTSGRVPTVEQVDSTHKLCEFFINEYPDLPNVTSWDKVRGHKELPNQSTACPGDDWPSWRIQIVEGIAAQSDVFLYPNSDRKNRIAQLYKTILGREADLGGLEHYIRSEQSIEQITESMVNSKEHQNLINMAKKASDLETQVSNLQTSLASVNQQVILLREVLQEREQEINKLKMATSSPTQAKSELKVDQTLTIIQALVNLYKFLLPPGKDFN
ncbi:N-acetylmuramoyl-L-alanine amidase, partial [Candidatus Daviesbacteria bacterium]|nr:N-acetylmuramoyl-L-alanine amidase [Candidatus Daviesbacteria bacterium]